MSGIGGFVTRHIRKREQEPEDGKPWPPTVPPAPWRANPWRFSRDLLGAAGRGVLDAIADETDD